MVSDLQSYMQILLLVEIQLLLHCFLFCGSDEYVLDCSDTHISSPIQTVLRIHSDSPSRRPSQAASSAGLGTPTYLLSGLVGRIVPFVSNSSPVVYLNCLSVGDRSTATGPAFRQSVAVRKLAIPWLSEQTKFCWIPKGPHFQHRMLFRWWCLSEN